MHEQITIMLTKDYIKALIMHGGPGPHVTVNDNRENVVITIVPGESMTTETFQKNGWSRVNEYDINGDCISESYEY